MDNEESDINEEVFERKTIFERFLPEQTIMYIKYCLLRIPFLLIYDYLFSDKFHLLIDDFLQYSNNIIDRNQQISFKFVHYILHSYFFQSLLYINLNFSIPVIGFVLLIISLLCSDRRLLSFYSYTISFFIIYFYYQINSSSTIQFNMFILQFMLSLIYIQMLNIRTHLYAPIIQKCICHLAPFIYLLTRYFLPIKFSIYILNFYYLIWILIYLSESFIYQRYRIFNFLKYNLINDLINLYNNLAIPTLIHYLQEHIQTVVLLKIFLLTKIFILPLGIRTIYTNPYLTIQNQTNITNYNETLIKTFYFTIIFYGTETIFTLVSLACLVSYIMKKFSHYLFRCLHIWTEDVEQIGTVIGIMFFLLLVQSNIIRLDLNRRHIPLLKAFSLIIVAIFHFLHTILEPQLLQVAMQTMTTNIIFEQTNQNRLSSYFSRKILNSFHHRHVYTCLILLILLIFYLILLWNITTFSTWLLAITAFLLELIIRLIGSLAQYTLYVLDAHNCLKTNDSFDEYIFRVKAVTSILEFILGVFLLCNGFYILFYEARGALRAFILAIHAHLNIIKNLRRGLQIFRNRRSAWDNVNQLPLATEEEINNYNDICSICHNNLTNGNTCITPCSHLFHQKCLQKVLYVTSNCPLCLRPIIGETNVHQQ